MLQFLAPEIFLFQKIRFVSCKLHGKKNRTLRQLVVKIISYNFLNMFHSYKRIFLKPPKVKITSVADVPRKICNK